MSLPPDYLRYPQRRYGLDHTRYTWRPLEDRRVHRLPGGSRLAVAIVAPLESFMLNPSGKPFRHPGAMQTPYPDLRHYTARDYGLRVGAFRLLDAFAAAGVKATFAVNAVLLERTAPLIEAIRAEGHEIAAHGWDTDNIHWSGLDRDTEARLVVQTRAAFAKAGLAPRAWMSPARQQSFDTPDLIRAAGFDICLDWEIDNTPVPLATAAGVLQALPIFNELDDRLLLTVKNHSEEAWRDQILEAARLMAGEYERFGTQSLGFTMTPYIAGLPFRMKAVRDILAGLGAEPGIDLMTASQIADAFQ